MADRQKTSWVACQVENTSSIPLQKSSWVACQVENTSSISLQKSSWVACQVEYVPISGEFTYDSGGVGSLPGGLDPDYTSIATWEADTDVDLRAAGYEGDVILNCYDSQTHSITGTITIEGATNVYWQQRRILRSSPNCAIPFAGKAGTGANFCFGSSVNDYFYSYEEYFTIEYCCVTSDPASSGLSKLGIYLNCPGAYQTVACGVVCHDITNSGGSSIGFFAFNKVIFNHCIAYGCGTNGITLNAYFNSPTALHCTSCDNGSYGIYHENQPDSAISWGNYCGGNATGFYENAVVTYSAWNASSDATADLGGDAGDNYKNNYDLLDDNLDADYLPTSPTGLSGSGGAGDNFGRNPYNDLSAYNDYANYLKNDFDGMPESKKDIRGNDRPSGEVADVSWAVGAAEYQEGEEPPVSGEIAMPNVILF